MMQKHIQTLGNSIVPSIFFIIGGIITLVFFPAITFASTSNGTINQNSYAWSTKSGWINFSATHGNVSVTDSALSGYLWSSKHGWIKLNPTNGGVTNNNEGTLSGSAWGEQLGWINFSGVYIDIDGRFHGKATGENIGTLTFDCNYCSVQTDWRPFSIRTPQAGGGSGSGREIQITNNMVATPILTNETTSSAPTINQNTPISIIPEIPQKTKEQIIKESGVTQSLQYGKQNDPQEVKKLQKFLREHEGVLSIRETGVFDVATRNAVILFQERYAKDILKPNGLTKGTGIVGTSTILVITKILTETTSTTTQKINTPPITPEKETGKTWTTLKKVLEDLLLKIQKLFK